MAELSAKQATAGRLDVDAVSIRNGHAYWLERRPATGRTALVRVPLVGDDRPLTMTPDGFDVGSRVHEYGGGAYWVADDDAIFVVNQTDQRIYRLGDGIAQPLTPASGIGATVRHADLRSLTSGWLVCVRERHEPDRVVNELVRLPTDGSMPAVVVERGRDFYSFPRVNPSGTQLAFTCWDQPQMPWDGTELWLADLAADGSVTGGHRIAGGPDESLFQPEWSPNGQLYVMSDRAGWWNLYRVQDGGLEPVYPTEAECGEPQWEFGYSTYAFLDADHAIVLSRDRGEDGLLVVDLANGRAEQLPTEATSIKAFLAAGDGHVAYIGGTATQLPAVLIRCADNLNERSPARSQGPVPAAEMSRPERHWVPSEHPCPIPIWLHIPASSPDRQPPPLLVRPHPGPTSQTRNRLDLETQFFTSRGFAVVDVDYRGSTGFGRAYRQAITHLWGIADAEDCITVARWLADERRTDPVRTVISGSSAGGFTAIRALILSDVFVAATCVSGIVDLLDFSRRTHKFQRHELDRLVGPLPKDFLSYEGRSPLNLVDQVDRPVLLAHGLDDSVAPAGTISEFAHALRLRDTPHILRLFEHDGHPPTQPKNRAAILEAELSFYRAVFAGNAPAESAAEPDKLV